MIDLKPCPYCGGSAEMLSLAVAKGEHHFVVCRDCHGGKGSTKRQVTKEAAAERWNTRVAREEASGPQTPYWYTGGAPMCWTCIGKEFEPGEVIWGGYSIETDKQPLCEGCGVELNLQVIQPDIA